MWSLNSVRSQTDAKPTRRHAMPRRTLALTLVGLAAIALAGCGTDGFRPMYAASPDGSGLGDRLASVRVTTIPGRVGQLIRNELVYETRGGGEGRAPVYQLDVAVREKEISTLVNKEGDALSRVYTVTASFQLVDIKSRRILLKGESYGRAGYERFKSIFSNVRAQGDAKRRSALVVARDIKSRLEAFLAGGA